MYVFTMTVPWEGWSPGQTSPVVTVTPQESHIPTLAPPPYRLDGSLYLLLVWISLSKQQDQDESNLTLSVFHTLAPLSFIHSAVGLCDYPEAVLLTLLVLAGRKMGLGCKSESVQFSRKRKGQRHMTFENARMKQSVCLAHGWTAHTQYTDLH